MKFSLIALAGALTTANAASSVVPKTFKLNGKRNLRRGDASTEALLQKAVPYNRKNINRHLEEEDDAAAEQGDEAANDEAADEEEAAAEEEEAAIEPSSASTISFGKCVDVKTRDEDLFSEDLVEQVQAGNVMSLKSYVIFDVCNDTYGYGCSESNSVEYMVDLATYLSVVGMKQANQRTDYCEQCERFQDSCAAAAEEEEEQADAEEAYEEEAVDEEQEGEEVEQEGEEEQGEQEQEQEGEEAKDEQEQEGEEEQGEQEQGEQEFEEEKEEQDAQAYAMANGNSRKLKQTIDCNQCESLQCFADDAEDAENGQADIDTMVAEWIEEVANCKATDQYVNGMQVYLGPICSDGAYFEIGAFLNEDCTIHTNLASFSEIAAGEQDNYDVDVAGYAISALKAAVYEPMTCESQEFADVNEEEEEEENEEENNEMNDYCKQLFEGEQSVKFSDCAAAEEEEQDEEQEEEEADEDYSWYSYDMEEADDIEETCSKVVSFNGEYTRYYDSSVNGTIHENESSVSIFGITAIVVACVAVVGLVASSLTKKKKQSPVLLDEPIYQGGQMS